MSDLATHAKLARSNAQLPVNVYFDEALLKREMQQLFQAGPRYIGHELMVPEIGDFATLAAEDEGRMLVRNGAGIEVLSNVCRHRQALMFNGRGNANNIVCPLHRWTYDLKGELIGAPHFADTPCLNLSKTPLQNWNGLLFEQNGYNVMDKLRTLSVTKDLDFSGYMFDHVEIHECDYNWKTFIEVYLEDYHVEPFHPGLGNFVSCDDLKWYPHVLVVSTLWPIGPQKTRNVVEFYYPEEIVLFEREFVEAERAAYMETAVEDDEIGLRMDAGRKILLARGVNEVGPYQSPMEDGMQHFHEWYRSRNVL